MKPSDSKERVRERVRRHRAKPDVTPPVTPPAKMGFESKNYTIPAYLDADGNAIPDSFT